MNYLTSLFFVIVFFMPHSFVKASKEKNDPNHVDRFIKPYQESLLKPITTKLDALKRFKNLVVFGDSMSDQGLLNKNSFGLLVKPDTFWRSRWSNGPNWVDYVSKALNLATYNYAVGGAETRPKEKFYERFLIPDLFKQIKTFKEKNLDLNPKETLYVMWVGHNNYFWDKNAHVENTIADIKKAATSLARLGAEHIVIGKMARLGDSPAVYAGKGKPKKTLREFSENHNDELINVIKDLKKLPGDKSYYTFDAFSVSIATQENPDDYGFQELNYPCYRGNIFGFYPDPKFCQKPFTTKYWDEAHPNTVMFCYYALRFLEDVSMSEGLFSENRKVCQSLTEDESLDQD